jgi:TonB family protein
MVTKGYCLGAVALFVAAPAQSQDDGTVWPTVAPERILSTPDWSDYQVYPETARRKSQEGRVVAGLLIDIGGTPSACRIDTSSGYPELDSGTCALMMTMRFVPAHDMSGQAVASTFRRTMRWVLGDARPFASGSLDARLDIVDGRLAGCDVTAKGGYVAYWSMTACSFFADTAYYFGSNAATVRHARIAVRLDAADQDPLLDEPWPDGQPISQQRVTFTINKEGDPSECKILLDRGFGPRGLNNLSPCGRLLSDLWLKKAKGRHGTFETRVYPWRIRRDNPLTIPVGPTGEKHRKRTKGIGARQGGRGARGERYLLRALRAQTQCRATLNVLAGLGEARKVQRDAWALWVDF